VTISSNQNGIEMVIVRISKLSEAVFLQEVAEIDPCGLSLRQLQPREPRTL
jgi:hypothetical protein